MPLKKISAGIKKPEGGSLKKIDAASLAKRREAAKALDFVSGREPDVLADMPDDLAPEADNVERMRRLDVALNGEKAATDGSTMKADLKRQGEAFKNQGAIDYYRVICFADGGAAAEFLKRVGVSIARRSLLSTVATSSPATSASSCQNRNSSFKKFARRRERSLGW